MNIIIKLIVLLLPGIFPTLILNMRNKYDYQSTKMFMINIIYSSLSYLILNFIINFNNIMCNCNYKNISIINYIFFNGDIFKLSQLVIAGLISLLLLYITIEVNIIYNKYFVRKTNELSFLLNLSDSVQLRIECNNAKYVGEFEKYNYLTNTIVLKNVKSYDYNNVIRSTFIKKFIKLDDNILVEYGYNEYSEE